MSLLNKTSAAVFIIRRVMKTPALFCTCSVCPCVRSDTKSLCFSFYEPRVETSKTKNRLRSFSPHDSALFHWSVSTSNLPQKKSWNKNQASVREQWASGDKERTREKEEENLGFKEIIQKLEKMWEKKIIKHGTDLYSLAQFGLGESWRGFCLTLLQECFPWTLPLSFACLQYRWVEQVSLMF